MWIIILFSEKMKSKNPHAFSSRVLSYNEQVLQVRMKSTIDPLSISNSICPSKEQLYSHYFV